MRLSAGEKIGGGIKFIVLLAEKWFFNVGNMVNTYRFLHLLRVDVSGLLDLSPN